MSVADVAVRDVSRLGLQSGAPRQAPVAGACHLWLTRVDDQEDRWHEFLHWSEVAAAARRHVEAVRRTYVVSRGLQRLVGAHYLGARPPDVRIERSCEDCGSTGHGRPRWVDAPSLDFSASHSGGWVVLAVVGSGGVGVDLESRADLNPPEGLDDFAAAVLTPAERACYRDLHEAQRADYLCRMWVRKEAALKACGQGLRLEPSAVDVRGARVAVPHGSAAQSGRVASDLGLDPGQFLCLRDVPTEPGYRAALASTALIGRVTATVVHHGVPSP